MPYRGKLSPELKLTIVKRYLAGEFSPSGIVADYGIGKRTLRDWVRKFRSEGPEGLLIKPEQKRYDPDLKRKVAKEYLDGGISLDELCGKYQVSDTHVVRDWIRKYTDCEEFKVRYTRSESRMTEGRSTTLEERVEIVSYCLEKGRDYRAAIEKYQVSYQQIYSWVRKYETSGIDGLRDKRGKPKPVDEMSEMERLLAENRLLKAENKRKEMEIDILKKLQELERRRG